MSYTKKFGKAKDYVDNGEWHHIVEQQTVTKGINSPSSVYNSYNTVPIPKSLHTKISSYYSSLHKNGQTFRQYVNTLPYKQQYKEGLRVLKELAEKYGVNILWL